MTGNVNIASLTLPVSRKPMTVRVLSSCGFTPGCFVEYLEKNKTDLLSDILDKLNSVTLKIPYIYSYRVTYVR